MHGITQSRVISLLGSKMFLMLEKNFTTLCSDVQGGFYSSKLSIFIESGQSFLSTKPKVICIALSFNKSLRDLASPFQNIFGLILNSPLSPEINFDFFNAAKQLDRVCWEMSNSLHISSLVFCAMRTTPVFHSACWFIHINTAFALSGFKLNHGANISIYVIKKCSSDLISS